MGLVAAVLVGADQRTDQQHAGARRAEQARRDRAEAENDEIGPRRADDVAGDPDTAGDHEQRQEQDDEGQIFVRRRIEHGGADRGGSAPQAVRHDKEQRPCGRDGPETALPPVPGHEWEDRDRQEQAREGQAPGERDRIGCGAVWRRHGGWGLVGPLDGPAIYRR